MASEGDDAEGPVVLLVARYRDWLWGRLVQPRLGLAKRYVRVPLEARGSALWRAIDGRRTVREMVDILRATVPADDDDLHRRVCLYLQSLFDNGFIAWSEPADPLP